MVEAIKVGTQVVYQNKTHWVVKSAPSLTNQFIYELAPMPDGATGELDNEFGVPHNEIMVPERDVIVQTEPPAKFAVGQRVMNTTTRAIDFIGDDDAGFAADGVRLYYMANGAAEREDCLVAVEQRTYEEILSDIEFMFIQIAQLHRARHGNKRLELEIVAANYGGDHMTLNHKVIIGHAASVTTRSLMRSFEIASSRHEENELYAPKELPVG
jgi:hypothetical protein